MTAGSSDAVSGSLTGGTSGGPASSFRSALLRGTRTLYHEVECRQTDFNLSINPVVSRSSSRSSWLSGSQSHDRPREREAVTGADHRRQRPLSRPACPACSLANGPIRRRSAKRSAASTAPCRASSRAPAASLLVDSGRAQRLVDAPRAIAAPGQRPRLRQRIGRIVDIAEPREVDRPAPRGRRTRPRPSRARAACGLR